MTTSVTDALSELQDVLNKCKWKMNNEPNEPLPPPYSQVQLPSLVVVPAPAAGLGPGQHFEVLPQIPALQQIPGKLYQSKPCCYQYNKVLFLAGAGGRPRTR
ncbi:unnamed protein product, partial [Didymodactylos carnosus]